MLSGRAARRILASQAAQAAAGILIDRAVGEPPTTMHPVAWFGRVMTMTERFGYRDSRAAGAVHAILGTTLGAATGAALRSTAAATALAVAGRSLGDTALDIGTALDRGELTAARAKLPALVGRDPSRLSGPEVARAVVESVAENTVDGVVAPAFWAACCGAPGALGYRAVNTLDSMVGHRSARYHRYGWASARLDDVAAYLPARLTAALVGVARPRRAAAILQAIRAQASAHPSPNAGVAEAAFAVALGVRLGGVNRYDGRVENRPTLGAGRVPSAADIPRAVRLSVDVSLLLAALLASAAVADAAAGARAMPGPGAGGRQ
ncbi:MAG TPA: adenosylcobinamide-phosphate synthase CbiB [Streptosporangiaceae bacterium]|nr:adenosylcobinamide-phosphate synthase CbiB [Streptosporangiaceae bacterium]